MRSYSRDNLAPIMNDAPLRNTDLITGRPARGRVEEGHPGEYVWDRL